jgi:prepilin-type N-terminal cleavage/methylation domain-containing protein
MFSRTQNNKQRGFTRQTSIQRSSGGFTIIEVMIVLAIAGLIMLIVFLAVPALQRNSRNTQRSNDAARTVAALNECSTNFNGNLIACLPNLGEYIDISQNQQLTLVGAPGPNTMQFLLNRQCNASGTGTQTGGGTRAFTLTYHAETSGGTQTRCIQG